MSGRRRVQRSVRLTVATLLVCIAGGVVLAAVVLSAAVGAAAVLAAVTGLAAVRIMATEVVQTRRDTSRSRADQALAFRHALAGLRAEHSQAIDEMAGCLVQRDRSIRDLNVRLRATQNRAESAQERADRETQRADDAQTRLSEVLDAVLAQHVARAEPAQPRDGWEVDDSRGLPTVVDLLAWEERSIASRTELPRRHA
jgi:hypothetical protein